MCTSAVLHQYMHVCIPLCMAVYKLVHQRPHVHDIHARLLLEKMDVLVHCRFGHPLVLRVRRNLTQHQFQSVVLNALKEHLNSSPKELSEVCA